MILTTDSLDAATMAARYLHSSRPYRWRDEFYKVVRVERVADEQHMTLDEVMSPVRPRPPRWEITLEKVR